MVSKLFRVTALRDYANGAIPWPAGMSGKWPQGEVRLLPWPVVEQLQRDGTGNFDMQIVSVPVERPDSETNGDGQDRVDGAESKAPAEEAPAPPDDPVKAKRLAALAKARAARAAKKKEKQA